MKTPVGGSCDEDEGRKGYIERKRTVGRRRGRWLDAMDRDAKRMLKCRNWRMAED